MFDALTLIGPHPDDECLMSGGLLSACANLGIPSRVITVATGEVDSSVSTAAATSANHPNRRDEWEEGLDILGIPDRHWLGFNDFTLSSTNAWQLEVSTRVLPNGPILTYDADGGYGHPDHIACHEFVRRQWPDRALFVVYPSGLAQGTANRFKRYCEARFRALEIQLMPRYGRSLKTVPYRLKLNSELSRYKVQALGAHHSQHRGQVDKLLPGKLVTWALEYEWYAPHRLLPK